MGSSISGESGKLAILQSFFPKFLNPNVRRTQSIGVLQWSTVIAFVISKQLSYCLTINIYRNNLLTTNLFRIYNHFFLIILLMESRTRMAWNGLHILLSLHINLFFLCKRSVYFFLLNFSRSFHDQQRFVLEEKWYLEQSNLPFCGIYLYGHTKVQFWPLWCWCPEIDVHMITFSSNFSLKKYIVISI